METHLYMSCYRVEALIASNLPPVEFGTYMAVGTEKLTRGQVMFFEIGPGLKSDYFNLKRAQTECVPRPDGSPKRSLYISIYRVMEHLALSDYGTLYLATRDGRVLGIAPRNYEGQDEKSEPHLYQELCPVAPLIVSALPPGAFCRFITDPANSIYVPRIFFADMRCDRDKRGRLAGYLPYRHPAHIEHCVDTLDEGQGKMTKTVDRGHPMEFFYRMIRRGFFLGDQTGVKIYAFPTPDEMDNVHHNWWRSATM